MSDIDKILELSFENSRYFHFIADQNLKIKRLEAENAKLKECLEFYAVNGLGSVEIGHKIDTKLCSEFYVNGGYARKLLKELDSTQLNKIDAFY